MLQDLFTKFQIVSLKETLLGANQWLSENTKLTWTKDNSHSPTKTQPINEIDQKEVDPKNIMLTPMQIRTFVAEITSNTM